MDLTLPHLRKIIELSDRNTFILCGISFREMIFSEVLVHDAVAVAVANTGVVCLAMNFQRCDFVQFTSFHCCLRKIKTRIKSKYTLKNLSPHDIRKPFHSNHLIKYNEFLR